MHYNTAWHEVHHAYKSVTLHLSNGEVRKLPGRLQLEKSPAYGIREDHFWFDDYLEIHTFKTKMEGGVQQKIMLKQEFIDLTNITRIEFELEQ